jgi:hypothetical protein
MRAPAIVWCGGAVICDGVRAMQIDAFEFWRADG